MLLSCGPALLRFPLASACQVEPGLRKTLLRNATGDASKRASNERGGILMIGSEVLQSVQFVTVKGKRLAVLNADDWEALVEWIETLEDVEIAKHALAELKAAGGDRQQAGWLAWDEVEKE